MTGLGQGPLHIRRAGNSGCCVIANAARVVASQRGSQTALPPLPAGPVRLCGSYPIPTQPNLTTIGGARGGSPPVVCLGCGGKLAVNPPIIVIFPPLHLPTADHWEKEPPAFRH